jgi:hypothetical protein
MNADYTYPDVLPDPSIIPHDQLRAHLQISVDAITAQTQVKIDIDDYLKIFERKVDYLHKFMHELNTVGLAALRNTYNIKKIVENRFHVVLVDTDDIKISYTFRFEKDEEGGYKPVTDSSDELTEFKTVDGGNVLIREQWDGQISTFTVTNEWLIADKRATQETPVAATIEQIEYAQELAEDLTTIDVAVDPVSLLESIKLREMLFNRFLEIVDKHGLEATKKAGYRFTKSKRFDGVYKVTIYNSPDHIYKEVMTIIDGGPGEPLHMSMHHKSTIEMVVYERDGTRRRVYIENTPHNTKLTLMEEV